MEFIEHLYTFLKKEEADDIYKHMNREEVHCFKCNLLKIDINDPFILNNNFNSHMYINDAFIYNKEENELGKSIEFEAGAFYIQEPAAMMSEYILKPKAGDYVLDMCSAPGGKAFDSLVDMKDTGLLVCNDINELRSRILSSNIEKYGFANTIVLNDDSKKYKKYFVSFFDKIILDAPCSGSAMFRKNEDARSLWSLEKVLQCKEIQLSLLDDAYSMLKGWGELLYSTCSFSIQENEEVISEFINKYPDMEIIPIEINKAHSDTIGIAGGLRLYPSNFDGEGQTIFHLRKTSTQDEKRKIKLYDNVKAPKELIEFLNKIQLKCDTKAIINFGTHYYYADFPHIKLDGIKIRRFGLELGEMVNGRFEPSHSLAMYHGVEKSNYIELTLNQAKDYLRGLTIPYEGSSGFKIASYHGLALGWVKHVNNTLKNHYPKGLRHNF